LLPQHLAPNDAERRARPLRDEGRATVHSHAARRAYGVSGAPRGQDLRPRALLARARPDALSDVRDRGRRRQGRARSRPSTRLAAVPSRPRSVREPLRSHEAAATATLRLLLASRDAGVGTFVNSSSSSVYGDVAAPPMRESMPAVPRSPYAVAKLAAEGYTRT